MQNDEREKDEAEKLRRQAETLVGRVPAGRDVSTLAAEDMRKVIHELQIHQAELEIQNEELRRTQLELETARDKYADLYNFAPVGYFTFNDSGLILDVNHSGALLLNRERRFLIQKPFAALVSAGDFPKFYLYLNKVFQTDSKESCEINLEKQGVGQIRVRLDSIALHGAEGEAETCRTAVADITELERLKEEVTRTREQVLLNMMEGVCVCDERGVINFANPAFDAMFGYNRRELLGRNITELEDCNYEENSATFPQILNKSLADGNWRGHLRCNKKDGTPLYVKLTTSLVSLFGRKNIIIVWEDITTLKQAEARLRDSEQRFRAIFEGASDLIFLKDFSRQYTHVNPAFEEMFEKNGSSIVGLNYVELFGKEGSEYEADVDMRVLDGETVEEERSRNIGGVTRRFHEIRAPLRDGQGDIVGVFGIARDITERQKIVAGPTKELESYRSKAMRKTMQLALQAAKRDSIILLKGETGAGKDYVAKYIHDHSPRSDGPYFSINCGAVPGELAESELFGHERGSFTGAHSRKRGLLELAEGGTLLLNEIGELPLILQAKLLTFLDTRKFTRVGGEKEISVNARLIAATNRDLEKEVEEGRFRQDLLYRLNVMVIEVPPLRERLDDLPALVEQIGSRLAADLQLSHIPVVDPSRMKAFAEYHWPGNVRELRNVLERSFILGDLPRLGTLLPASEATESDYSLTLKFGEGRTLKDLTDEVTKSLCVEALRRSGGNKKEAAKLLGIARDSLYRHLRNFGIESEERAE
ncbi:MAG: sigma 54-interacting transcriptional regulator [Thermodesulfobacteriota bacterium]